MKSATSQAAAEKLYL